MSDRTQQLIDRYLDRLDAELAELPGARRRELVDEITHHIAEARAETPDAGEAEIRTLLDRLGEPEDIAAEAQGRFDVAGEPPRTTTWRETLALILLPVGGVLVPFVGWIVGAVLLWTSTAWNTRDKLVGTLLLPGGLLPATFFAVLAGSSSSGTCIAPAGSAPSPVCSSDGGASVLAIVGAIALFVLPLASVAYLALRLRVRTPAAGLFSRS
jgi:uncharacterized membrane protein